MRHGHLHLTRSILLLSVCVSFAGSLGPVAANGGSTPGAQSSATSKVYLPLVALTHPTLNATIATSIWTHLLGSTWAVGWDVAVDGNQNVYVVGHNYGDLDGRPNFGDADAFVSAYDSRGARRWVEPIQSEGQDVAKGVAVDDAGNVYVAGGSKGNLDGQPNAGDLDAFVSKYDSAGVRQWTRLLGSAMEDVAESVVVDNAGSVYVVGYTYGALEGHSGTGTGGAFICKYDSDGVRQWIRLLGPAGNDNDMALDRDGNIYIASTNSGFAFVSMYSSDGVQRWMRLAASGYSEGIAVDVRGNIYLVGSVNESIDGQPYSGQSDAFVMKYDGAGVRQWTRLLGSTGDDVAWDVTVDGNGGIYAAGHVDGSGDPSGQGKEDAFVSEYDETGALRWTHIFGSSAVDGAEGVAVSANGAIYLSGYTFGNLDGQANLGGGNAFVSRINP